MNRSFIYYPKSRNSRAAFNSNFTNAPRDESEKQLDRRKEELSSIIIQVLRQHPLLCYFQGFHDIVQVFLLVLGVEHAAEAIAHLSLLRIRDFMLPSLLPSLDHLKLLPSILEAADTKLCQHLSQTQPFFALAATLTLYAHDIQEYGDIARLFDFLIAQPAVVSIYFFANIIISRREELFAIPAEEPEMLHSILSKLPKPLNLEGLVMETMLLFAKHPPEKLPSRVWAKTSYCSVLKTTRASTQNQSLQAGEAFFGMQILQLRRFELRRNMVHNLWKHSRMFGGIGLAIAIGLVSFWFRRRGMEVSPILGTRKLLDSWRLFFR